MATPGGVGAYRPARRPRADRGRRGRLRALHQRGEAEAGRPGRGQREEPGHGQARHRAQAVLRLPDARPAARRHGAGAGQRPLRLGAVAPRPLARAPARTSTSASLTGTVGGGGGGGGSGIRSSISSPAIELAGCTKSQPAVARVMSRLRNVQGVTRVSLSKSEKSDTAAASGGGSATGGSTVGPCGKGSPPELRGRRLLREGRGRRRARHGDRRNHATAGRRHRRSTATATERPTPPARAPTTRLPRLVHPRRHPRRLIPCLAETRC